MTLRAPDSSRAPQLRNVALTAPYFHNGSQLTLEQVVEFYNRGGDFNTVGENSQSWIPDIERSVWDSRCRKSRT